MISWQSCVNCSRWRPHPHPGWQPKEYDREYDMWNLRAHLVSERMTIGERGWPGLCAAYPQPSATTSTHWCAQWEFNERLWTWNMFMDQARYWRDREELQGRLKAEIKRSRERYRQIRVLKGNGKDVQP